MDTKTIILDINMTINEEDREAFDNHCEMLREENADYEYNDY